MAITAYTDGCSLGNPGPMGIGVVIYHGGKKVKEIGEFIGIGTNNVAEYAAVIRALEYAKGCGERDVHVRADSELVVRQLRGEYRVRDLKLKPLKARVDSLRAGMAVRFEHIPREKNEEADALSKEGAEKGKAPKGAEGTAPKASHGKPAAMATHRKAVGQQKLMVFA